MFLSWKLHGIISYHQILTRKHFPIVWNLLLEKIWRKTWILPWYLHFMQNLFFGLWSKFKSWLRLPCVNIDYTLWIQLDTQIYNAKINDFICWRYILGFVLWGGEVLSSSTVIARLNLVKSAIYQKWFFWCFFIRNDLSRVDLIIKVVFKFLSDL